MITKNIFLILMAVFLLANPVSAWNITVNQTGESYIAWDVSQRVGPITSLAYDGQTISDYDPYANILIQSGLGSNETHFISAISDNVTASLLATTNTSLKNEYYAVSAQLWNFFNTWIYLGLIIVLFVIGAVLHWAFYFIGSFISLYALAKYLQETPVQVTDIWHLQYFIYLALFILGLLLWMMGIKKGRK